MTSEPHPHDEPHAGCEACLAEARFAWIFRTLWLRHLLPCRELHLAIELTHVGPCGLPVLLCVADVHGAPVDALAVSQVSLDMFMAVTKRIEDGAPDSGQRRHAALMALARPVVLTRPEVQRVLVAARRLFPGLLEDVLSEQAEESP